MKFLIRTLIARCLALTASAATFTVANTNDAGDGSLRQAILDSNSDTAPDAIAFNIPGSGMRVIRLLSALPTVAQPVLIDGFTQPGALANAEPNGNTALWVIELDGTMAGSNRDGLELQADVTVRGLRIANFNGYGIDVVGDKSVVAGCYILSNRLGGIRLDEVDFALVGGSSPGDRNVISGNIGSGVVLDDHGTSNRVFGNFIGTKWDGVRSDGNQGWGVHIFGPLRGNFIGGTNRGEANIVAFNSSGGVWADYGNGWNNSIRGNRIFSNGGLGIDLADLRSLSGVSTNDPGDADIGANQVQNYPLVTNAVISSTATTVLGTLNSQPNTQYALDFYGNTECHASTFGQGEFYLGTASVTTDSNGDASFEVNVPTTTTWRRYLSATATDPLGNTSEFSPCWRATTAGTTFTVVNTNDSGPGSFRQAVLEADRDTIPDVIAFNIPGAGLQVIQLSSVVQVQEPVTIDGFTQPGAKANTLSQGNNANWLIELKAMTGNGNNGLELYSDIIVRGLRISNFKGSGIAVLGDNCVVAGCFIYRNQHSGVLLHEDGDNTLIGGAAAADRNVLSGNLGPGILMQQGASQRVLGNWIGTDLTGSGSFGNQGWGIHNIDTLRDSRIGGTNSGEANVIAFNASGGVLLAHPGQNNPIRGNRIFANGGLGIDLDLPGVTANDLGDGDAGANRSQNFPLITNVLFNTTTTTVQGRLNSQANKQYVLDFYENTAGHVSGHGEGEFYLGSAMVTTDGIGNTGFEVTFFRALREFHLTATTTDPLGNTSEFSPSWPQPLRLEFTQLAGEGHELLLRTVDGSPIASDRLSSLRVFTATNPSPQSVWMPIPNSLELSNGVVRVRELELTNGLRFFRSFEVRLIPP